MARSRTSLELFLSLGLTAGLSSASMVIPAQAQPHQHHHLPATAQLPSGEGGEGGESGGSTVQSEVDLLVVLAQMQGHLLIAQELLSAKAFKAAEPHVGHPVDELYGAIDKALEQRKIAPFRQALEALRGQMRLDPQSGRIAILMREATGAISRAEQAITGGKAIDATTRLGVLRGLLQSAASEYAASEADGRIVETIEYQDARGFVLQALTLAKQLPASQSQQQRIRQMLLALPSATPPQRALMSPQQLRQLATLN